MLTVNDVRQDQLNLFIETALERHRIYIRKELLNEPKPWTDNPVFQEWFFCNLFRRYDKTTKLIVDKVIQPNEGNPYLWTAILISRWYSWIPTIELLVDNDCLFSREGWNRGVALLADVQRSGGKLVTAGFVTGAPLQGYPFVTKNMIPFIIVRDLALSFSPHDMDEGVRIIDSHLRMGCRSIEDTFNLFMKAKATAGFMAYEYATDLTYTQRYTPEQGQHPDYYRWGNYTVGSLRGLKRLCGAKPEEKVKVDIENITLLLRDNLAKRAGKLYKEYQGVGDLQDASEVQNLKDISMREIEHWLCEYDKYSRIHNKEKRMKRKYAGRA